MGRSRSWDEDAVLAAASAVFHRKGFEATSTRDIEDATGLRPGSVYAAYGSKAGLFAAVLDRYAAHVVDARVARYLTDAPDPRAGLRAMFTSTFEGRPAPDPGCLVTNSAVESPALATEARQKVGTSLDALRAGFFDAAQRLAGAHQGAAAAADQLLALYQGLLVLVRFGADEKLLRSVVDAVDVVIDSLEGNHES